jgi:four helix bundle protein
MQQSNSKQGILKRKASALALKGYSLTDTFPKEEMFGLSSQLRRSLVSVPSNIIEGLARNKARVFKNHLDIAYGSLCEAKYQRYFACQRKYITKEKYLDFFNDAEEVSKMLWASITTINKNLN